MAVTPIPGLLGVTTIEVSVALVVFTIDVPTMPPKTAVTVAAPGATPVTIPWKLGTLLAVAIDDGAHVQVTLLERFCVVPSANLPVATSGIVMPSGTFAGEGVMAIDCSGEDWTITFAVPGTLLNVAVMVELPADAAVTSPIASTVATVVSDDVQVATFD